MIVGVAVAGCCVVFFLRVIFSLAVARLAGGYRLRYLCCVVVCVE